MEIVQKIQILYLNDYIWQKKCQKGPKNDKKSTMVFCYQNCGFFHHFLAIFDTFSARYSHSGIKFEFFEQFLSKKHII